IQGLKIIHQVETPGLGTKIEEIRYGDENPWFQQQFLNKTAAEVALTKDKASGTITAITGATISSRAVTNSIANELKKMNRQLGLE
ncbi:FMN-binding protein, partial [bacterium]|nr:FMN-binding protein [bacterium]